jgi:hypothetical protein
MSSVDRATQLISSLISEGDYRAAVQQLNAFIQVFDFEEFDEIASKFFKEGIRLTLEFLFWDGKNPEETAKCIIDAKRILCGESDNEELLTGILLENIRDGFCKNPDHTRFDAIFYDAHTYDQDVIIQAAAICMQHVRCRVV